MTDKRTILYIEDDPASARLLDRLLTHAGYAVILAEDGLKGIDRAREAAPDLILTDINLPDISGYEIATTLRNDDRLRQTPIVALTADPAHDANRDMATAAGITGYLTKPIDVSELLDQLAYYLEGGQDEKLDTDRLLVAQVKYTREVVERLEKRIRELEEVNSQLRKLDKVKENFIQITAHELRTPITLVIGYSRLLSDHALLRELAAQDANIHKLLNGLGDAVHRMHIIIEEIMITSRILAGQMTPTPTFVNIGHLTRQVIHHYEQALNERNLTIHFDPQRWPKRLVGDTEMLRMLVNNLLSNAIKYTPDGGHIYLHAETQGDQVEFSVRDTGIGIDPDDQERIFEEFDTLSDFELHSTSKTAFRGGGLGLGLPVCKGIVEAHDGTILVESQGYNPEICPGSRFVVILPLGDLSTPESRPGDGERGAP